MDAVLKRWYVPIAALAVGLAFLMGGTQTKGLSGPNAISADQRRPPGAALEELGRSVAHEQLAVPDGLPFFGAKPTTIEDAETALGAHIPRPNSKLASDATVSAVWINENSGQVAIDYSSGLELYATQDAAPADPAAAQEAIVSTGGPATGATVNGTPAVVMTGNYPGDCPTAGPTESD